MDVKSVKKIRRSAPELKTKVYTEDIFAGDNSNRAEGFGFFLDGGRLVSAPTIERYSNTILINAAKAVYEPYSNVSFMFASPDFLFVWNGEEMLAGGRTGSNTPVIFCDESRGYPLYRFIGGGKNTVLTEDYDPSTMNCEYDVECGVYHCGRVFAMFEGEENTIHWSGFNYWPIEFEGMFRLDGGAGKIVKLFSVKEKIYAVRERGVNVITALADSRNFSARPPVLFGGGTISGTAVTCHNGNLYLASEGGLYVFDGYSFKRLPLTTDISGNDFTHIAVLEDRYVCVTMHGREGGSFKNLLYDVKNGGDCMFANGCFMPSALGMQSYMFSGLRLYKLVNEENESYFWRSVPFGSGSGGTRVLKRLFIESSGGLRVEVDGDGLKRTFSERVNKVAMNACTFIFKVTGAGRLKKLTAEWEVRL